MNSNLSKLVINADTLLKEKLKEVYPDILN